MSLNSKKYKFIDRLIGCLCLASVVIFGVYSFASSHNSYVEYEKEYEANVQAALAKTPKAPEEVIIDNDFVIYNDNGYSVKESKSSYKNIYTCMASEATFYSIANTTSYAKVEINNTASSLGTNVSTIGPSGGGGVEFTFNVEYGCYADIDVVLASAFFSPDVNGNIAIIIQKILNLFVVKL